MVDIRITSGYHKLFPYEEKRDPVPGIISQFISGSALRVSSIFIAIGVLVVYIWDFFLYRCTYGWCPNVPVISDYAISNIFFVFAFMLAGLYSKSKSLYEEVIILFNNTKSSIVTFSGFLVGTVEAYSLEFKHMIMVLECHAFLRVIGYVMKHGQRNEVEISKLPLSKVYRDKLKNQWKQRIGSKGRISDSTAVLLKIMTIIKENIEKIAKDKKSLTQNVGLLSGLVGSWDTDYTKISSLALLKEPIGFREIMVFFVLIYFVLNPWIMIPLYGFYLSVFFQVILIWGFIGITLISRKLPKVFDSDHEKFTGEKIMSGLAHTASSEVDMNFMLFYESQNYTLDKENFTLVQKDKCTKRQIKIQ